MSPTHSNQFPKLHNAAWPGVVGKGPDSEPPIELDTMLDLTAAAEVDGVRFDGVDLFLFAPHVDIDSTDDDLKQLADKVRSRNLVIGSVVAPVWPPTGGGSAMGNDQERKSFLTQVLKGCRIAKKLRELGARPYGVVRIDSAVDPGTWSQGDATANSKKIADTFREAAVIAEDHGERLAAEGEICWGACTVGGAWCSFWKWSIGPRPSVFRPTWPIRCSICSATTRPRIAFCPRTSIGMTPPPCKKG